MTIDVVTNDAVELLKFFDPPTKDKNNHLSRRRKVNVETKSRKINRIPKTHKALLTRDTWRIVTPGNKELLVLSLLKANESGNWRSMYTSDTALKTCNVITL